MIPAIRIQCRECDQELFGEPKIIRNEDGGFWEVDTSEMYCNNCEATEHRTTYIHIVE